MGWGMNPEALVQEHLASGALVELTTGRPVDIELHWQSWRLSGGWFGGLSEMIVEEARQQLRR
jgi:LysR family transcriptional regulator (chromosome initiation inhibitor)